MVDVTLGKDYERERGVNYVLGGLWGRGSVIEHLLSVCEALGSSPRDRDRACTWALGHTNV